MWFDFWPTNYVYYRLKKVGGAEPHFDWMRQLPQIRVALGGFYCLIVWMWKMAMNAASGKTTRKRLYLHNVQKDSDLAASAL